jgi:DNA mismatch endonuclease (patch repair protein)
MDTLTQKERSERMGLVRGRDTKPELLVRRITHSMGYRYRLHYARLPGKPDLAFPERKKVIFVHGCFWHRHPDPACKLARMPKSRLDFWKPKLEGNRARDLEKQHLLREMDWDVLVIWECQMNDLESLASRINEFLEG